MAEVRVGLVRNLLQPGIHPAAAFVEPAWPGYARAELAETIRWELPPAIVIGHDLRMVVIPSTVFGETILYRIKFVPVHCPHCDPGCTLFGAAIFDGDIARFKPFARGSILLAAGDITDVNLREPVSEH